MILNREPRINARLSKSLDTKMSLKICSILVRANWCCLYHVIEAVQYTVVVGVELQSVCEIWKPNRIWFGNFKSSNWTIMQPNQPESFVNKFLSSCKNLEDQTKLCKSKSLSSKVVFQTIEVNLVSSTRRVSGEIGILHFIVFRHLYDHCKTISGDRFVAHVSKILQNFWLTFYIKSESPE